MKRIYGFLTAAAVILLSSCTKIGDNGYTASDIAGKWYEYYDPTIFAMDGAVEYTFHENETCERYIYDNESHTENTEMLTFFIEGNIITLKSINPVITTNTSYEIVLLEENEMAWQKVGTTYSEGTWHSDYRHFLRLSE